MMNMFRRFVVSALLLGAVCGEQLTIPQVEAVVGEILIKADSYVHYTSNVSEVHDPPSVRRRTSTKRASTYWYENIAHEGISAFGPSGYTVYRNVKDYGATGNGVTDDTAAINNAILAGGRCGEGCASSTTTPAVVYFPAGTYLISSSIIDQYFTILLGDPTNVPTLKATAGFSGFGLIDGDTYYTANLNWGSTNVFYRQVRNFIFDMTAIPCGNSATGIHWPTAQATSLQNLVFNMCSASGTQHVGLFCESGSGGFVTDLTFNGGLIGAQVGNQQFTMRNLIFNNCVTAISQLWDWEWVYQGISINNCQVGINIAAGDGTSSGLSVGSVTLVDSTITNTPVGIITGWSAVESPATANSLILENIVLSNVPVAVKQVSSGATLLAGGSLTISAWGEGNEYTPTGPKTFSGSFTPNSRPASLLSGSKYYTRSKPTYQTIPATSFKSVRAAGATGNGVTDDTAALQSVINSATAAGDIVYFDAGTYRVTSTLTFPPGAKVVGEAYARIMSSGSFFNNMNSPQPVVQVGTPGSTGQVEWSDMLVSTQGQQQGAILIQWNLATTGSLPSGMWDVHTAIGGFTGSDLQVAQCPVTASSTTINTNCIAAYMTMHVTPSASGLYMENCWLWTADHDQDSSSNTQVTIFNGRGLFIESTAGTFWLIGTAVEHHVLYQYQFANTKNIYAGVIQTETPYYQPNPGAPAPFTVNSALTDPNFATSCAGQSGRCNDAWGLRIVNSQNILIYAAGLYSFFNNNDATVCPVAGTDNCQNNIFSLEGTLSNVNVYCLGTVGAVNMITEAGTTLASYSNNENVYPGVIALFQLASGSGGGPPPPSTTVTSSLPTTMSTVTTTTTSHSVGPSGWTFLGCYSDNVNARTLKNSLQVPGGASAMTVELCEATCIAAGYVLAGVEYSGECWCDNVLENGGGPASDGNAECTMTCSGAPQETCGGPNRLDLYSHASTTGAPTVSKTSTSSGPTASATGWNFRGCYTDNVSARTLPNGEQVAGGTNAMTNELCQSTCLAAGFDIAGTEYAGECWCGDAFGNGGGPAPDGSTGCNMPCKGNSAEICGGSNRLDVWTYGVSNSTA